MNDVPSERDENRSSSREQTSTDDVTHDRTIRLAPEVHETSNSTVNSETSFLPGQGAFSSTPAMDRLASTNNDTFTTQNSDDPSWSTSMESPLVRLNREITNFSIHDNAVPSTSSSKLPPTTQVQDESDYPSQEDTSIGILPPSAKGKGKDTSHPLLKNVLRHNLYSASDNSSFDSPKVSPLKFRGKPKTPIIDKRLNPYLRPSDTSTSEWSGVVDLRDPSMRTPQRYRSGKSYAAASGKTPRTPYTDDDDDSLDGLPPGMSPPVLMSPARPPRSSAELGLLKLGQTPARDASARIQRDLLRDVQLKSGGGKRLFRGDAAGEFSTHQYESSMSTVPTPPSLSRYNRHGHDYSSSNSSITKDSSLESMIRRIRADLPSTEPASYVGGTALAGAPTTPGLRVRPRAQQPSQNAAQSKAPEPPNRYIEADSPITPTALPPPPPHQDDFDDDPITPGYNPHNEQDLDSDSDSLDEINNTAHPSAAFLMASQGIYDDDSFGSNHSSDSLENELDHANIGLVPVHPFAANAVEDDGFDEDDDDLFDNRGGGYEETVFGVAPAQRQQSAAAQARLSNGEGLRMLGEDLLQDTIGIGSHMAATGGVEESPTPANWG